MPRPKLRSAKPAVKAEPDPLAGVVTDEQELALALWLWKSLRCHGALTTHGKGESKTGANLPTFESLRLGDKAIALAKKYGVKREFFALLFELKLVKVSVKAME